MVKNFRQADVPGISLSGAPQTPEAAAWLHEQGIRAVVSLHPVSEEVAAALAAHGIAHLPFPVTDFCDPLPDDPAALARFVAERAATGVLLH